MPLRKKTPTPLRVAVFGDEKTFMPVIATALINKNCQLILVDNTLSPLALRELHFALCIIDLAGLALTQQAFNFMRRLPPTLPIIAVIDKGRQEFEFAEIFDVLSFPLDIRRLGEDIDYLRMVARPDALGPPPPPTDAEIEEYAEFLSRHCGLHFDRRNRKILERGIQKRMNVVLAPSVAAYLTYLENFHESRQELKKLVSLLTIGETSFFRFDPHFSALIEQVIPELIKEHQATRRLRIWSAGCSTGEEVYSLAIVLLQYFPQLANWDVTILGTDISHPSLTTAREGIYGERTLRHVTTELLAKWFVQSGTTWTVSDRLRLLTRFSFLNLQSESYPNPKDGTTECDLIFCRNVMIYFRPETVRAVVSRLRRALRPGGYLFLGHSETLGSGFLDFVRCQHHGGVYYQAGENENAPPRHDRPDKNEKQPEVVLFKKIHENALLPGDDIKKKKEISSIILADQVDNRTVSPNDLMVQAPPAGADKLLLEQGFLLADQGRFDEALGLCQQILKRDDLCPQAYFLRGLIFDQQGQSLAAVEDFQRVILLDIKVVMAHYHLANVYRKIGRQTEALRSLKAVIRLLTKMAAHEVIPEAKDWTVTGLLERCATELKQLEK